MRFSSNFEDNLPDVRVGLHLLVSSPDFLKKCLEYGHSLHLHLEGEDGVHDGPEAPVRETGQDVAAEGGDELGLVLRVPRPEQGASQEFLNVAARNRATAQNCFFYALSHAKL